MTGSYHGNTMRIPIIEQVEETGNLRPEVVGRPTLSKLHCDRVHRARLHIDRDFHSLVNLRRLAKWGLGPNPSDIALAHEITVRKKNGNHERTSNHSGVHDLFKGMSKFIAASRQATGKGRDLRDSRGIGRGLIVEVAENGKRRVSWDNSEGGKSSFKWVIRAPIEQKEEVGIGLGPKHLEAHYVSNLSPMNASPYHLEAGECSNTFLDPIPSTLNPDGLEENPTVSPFGVVMPIELSRSEGSFLVSQLHVVSPATERQFDLFTQLWSASLKGVLGCTENIQHMVFRFSPDRNSILGSNRLSGGLIFEGKWSITLEFVP
nr:hypothetical protein CFP56_53832 [Quercus suber]